MDARSDAPGPEADASARVEDLVFECLEHGADRERALDVACARHPEFADRLRARVARLAALGLVDAPECAAPQVTRPSERFGPFRILRRLGSGGMGVVYLAVQEHLQRQVALKLLHPGTLGHPRLRARFRREVEALSRIDHPHICTVFDAGELDGMPYLAMRYVSGITLDQRIERDRAAAGPSGVHASSAARVTELVELLEKVARALHTAHEAGVVHRDVKPANIMVDDRGEPAVLDFGLAHDDLASGGHLTRSADQVGTPNFMAPEQIAPDRGSVDRRTDVYQLGVTAYRCLTLQSPFEVPTREGLYRAILAGQLSDPRTLPRVCGRELEAVVLKAMACTPGRRFATALELAEELERIRLHRPILTRRPGPLLRLVHWCQRNHVAAVFLAMLSIGLVVTAVLASILSRRTEEFEMLATVMRLRDARKAEVDLYPAWPDRIVGLDAWLRTHGEALRDELPGLRRTVRELESRARPQSATERAAERRNHPRFADLELLQARTEALRRAEAVRDGSAIVTRPELPAGLRGRGARELAELAWPLVTWDESGRTWGREPFALALAEEALRRLDAGDGSIDRPAVLTTLAAAWIANGREAEAAAVMREAVAAGTAAERDACAERIAALHARIAAAAGGLAAGGLADLEAERDALDEMISRRRSWTFDDDATDFLYRTLTELVAQLEEFERKELAGVRERLAWARQIERLTNGHPRARATWAEARAAIAAADGVLASELYHEMPIDLQPQTGLVPIGPNPVTGLWEFYHLRSAWDPGSGIAAADDLPIPEHRPNGSIDVTDETGIVFVLIPGGTFRMGAQRDDADASNYETAARPDEQPHAVALAPFFLARHELTRGQWRRLSGAAEPGFYTLGVRYRNARDSIGAAHPVESVTPDQCDDLLGRHGLVLPTEAQWEYGCRAGTTTPWSTGTEASSLAGHGNVSPGDPVETADRPVPLLRVGSLLANAFGLFDMHGNLAEWCRDRYGDYQLPLLPGDGLRDVRRAAFRVYRGGSNCAPADDARSARRDRGGTEIPERALGLRAARALYRMKSQEDHSRWVERRPAISPPPRFWHAMAYDSARERVVLFGGTNGWAEVGPRRMFGDTWEWDGARWIERHPLAGPEGRALHGMAYDVVRRRVVLFGGQRSDRDHLGDTWEWDGERWELVAAEGAGPSKRCPGLVMAYDVARAQVVMAGWHRRHDGRTPETWVWDGRAWTRMWVATPRSGRTLVYDAGRRRTVLTADGEAVWHWDGSQWHPSAMASTPPTRGLPAVAYDAARGRMVLFGGGFWGRDGSVDALGDTWELDGERWLRRAPLVNPPARYGHAMVYDEARRRVVLFGGYAWAGPASGPDHEISARTVFQDTWEYLDEGVR